tara:strand:- start:585 stop:1181 length:597 start_codon:yes stop_codon:yes gene_type:complete
MNWLIEFYQNLSQEGSNLSILEVSAVIASLIYVYLAAKTNRNCFIFGGISSAIYVYICIKYRLFFDTFLNGFYIIMSIIGFIAWNKPKTDQPIQFMAPKTFLWISLIGAAVVFLAGYIVASSSDASLPYVDAFTTIFALIGTVMVIKKYIENWIIWIIVDAVSVGLYYYKGLYFTALLFLIFTVIAIKGYLEWKKQIN